MNFISYDWVLHVQDLAAADTGLLNRWEVEITGRQDNALRLEGMSGVLVPDNSPAGIERMLMTAGDCQIRDVTSVDITHTYIGDLSVTLTSPSDIGVVLHDHSGGRGDNLIKTYASATTPGLSALRGQPVQGTWRLRVTDLEAKDVGKLNRWVVQIERDV